MINPLRSGLHIDPASGGLTDFWGLQSVGPKNHWLPDKVELCVGGREREVLPTGFPSFPPFSGAQNIYTTFTFTFTLLGLLKVMGPLPTSPAPSLSLSK